MKHWIWLLATLGFEYNPDTHLLLEADSPPSVYQRVLQATVKYNQQSAYLMRFQQNNRTVDFGGEHISVITSKDSLLGFARFRFRDEVNVESLPTKPIAEKIALDFVRKLAPDLLENKQILWIQPHSEPMQKDGKSIQVWGMKVKCRDLNTGLYFWVVVGADKQVITFERDIKWITFPGKRGTEKWLADAWLKKHYPL